MASFDRGPTLVEAAPFIERFRGELVVVKLGGELLEDAPVLERLLPQLGVLYRCGLRPVVVHGGGKQLDEECRRRGIAPHKVAGRRVTTPEVMQVVLAVVAQELNGTIVRGLGNLGVPARGYASGVTDAILCARREPTRDAGGQLVDWGEVGDIIEVRTALLLGDAGAPWSVPVLPSIGTLADGGRVNVNADTVAAQVAVAMGARKLVMLTNVAGVLDGASAAGPISELTDARTRQLLESSAVSGGMRPKLEEALHALEGGVSKVHIVSGVEAFTLLREIFTVEGCGTLITRS